MSHSSSDLRAPGTLLAGKYRVERVIGKGGMGIVLSAWHIALDQRVAVKLLLADAQQQPDAVTRFLREARAAAKIRSEHVARVIDTGTLEGGTPYMVMEFLAGSDLGALLQTQRAFAIEDAVEFVIQACEAIAEAHWHGIIHRDLKPSNLFLTARPDGSPIIKVLDFGISKIADDAGPQLTGTIDAMGTALYMSPEQMQQTRTVDHRTDIYALGIALHELLAGTPPFQANTVPLLCVEVLTGEPAPLRPVRPDVPEGLAEVIAMAHRRDREHRFASVADFVRALAPYAPKARTTVERILRMAGTIVPIAEAAPQALGRGATEILRAQVERATTAPAGSAGDGHAAPTGTDKPVATASTAPATSGRARVRLLPIAVGLAMLGGAGAGIFAIARGGTDPRPSASAVPANETPATSARVSATAPAIVPSVESAAPPPATDSVAEVAPSAAPSAVASTPSAPVARPNAPPRPTPQTTTVGPRKPPTDVGF